MAEQCKRRHRKRLAEMDPEEQVRYQERRHAEYIRYKKKKGKLTQDWLIDTFPMTLKYVQVFTSIETR